ncbi:MAG: hypothetical protein HY741_08530 [Chloroflexi bacterium]|nr:hypothetical protein [Chloroflexota bacterium]
MSKLQSILLSILPASWAQDAEGESRQWIMQCPTCGYENSVWDAGGIRWKAAGNPRRRMKCPSCGQTTWFKLFRRATE